MANLLLLIWQLPQFIVGVIVACFWRTEFIVNYYTQHVICFYSTKQHRGGLSLGPIVLLDRPLLTSATTALAENTERHELGHSRQSKIFGPFYLIIIGLPSFIHKCLYDINTGKDYYDFWTEKWADKLGGVKR